VRAEGRGAYDYEAGAAAAAAGGQRHMWRSQRRLALFSPRAFRRALGQVVTNDGMLDGEGVGEGPLANSTSADTALDAKPLDYVLTMLTDVRRLPLPCFSDPFAVRWLTRAAGVFEGSVTKPTNLGVPREEVARYERAEGELKQRLAREASVSPALLAALSNFEQYVGLQRASGYCAAGEIDDEMTAADWLVVAEALYPYEGARGFVRFKRTAEEGMKLADKAKRDKSVKRLVTSYGS